MSNEEKFENNNENNNEISKNTENAENTIEEVKVPSDEKVPVKKTIGREISEWVCSIAIALVVAFILSNYVVLMAMVDGNSMLPTLHDGERLVVWRLGYTPHKGDIVILNPPKQARGPFVKRVIATEGDTVRIDSTTGEVYVNGEKLEEDYLDSNYVTTASQEIFEVPQGHFFVMGDNRSPGGSNDSRNTEGVGYIPNENLIGKVVFRVWPLNMIGIP